MRRAQRCVALLFGGRACSLDQRACDKRLVRMWKLWGFPLPVVKNFSGMYTVGPLQRRSRANGWEGDLGGSLMFLCLWGGGRSE